MDNILEIEKLKEQAVEKALNGDFHGAIEINKQILNQNDKDTDTMMQLAHAYWQSGQLSNARQQYQNVLSIEPMNGLAKKKLALLKSISKNDQPVQRRKKGKTVPITDLIEEPGKTKTLRLGNIGKPEHISLLSVGEEVKLKIRKRKIEVRDFSNNFIGYVPDDVSKRLIELIQNGCEYEAFVFSIDKKEVKIFIHEIGKSTKFKNTSSFVSDESLLMSLEGDTHTKAEDEEDLGLDEELEEELVLTPEERRAQKNKTEEEEEESEDQPPGYEEFEE